MRAALLAAAAAMLYPEIVSYVIGIGLVLAIYAVGLVQRRSAMA
jgi:hypothetical protein